MPPITTNAEPTDLWPKTPLFIEQSSVSALSHHDPSSAGFTTNIAESNIWYAQGSRTQSLRISLADLAAHASPDELLGMDNCCKTPDRRPPVADRVVPATPGMVANSRSCAQ